MGVLIIDNRVHLRLPPDETYGVAFNITHRSHCSEIGNTLIPLCTVLDHNADDAQLSILLKFIRDQDAINMTNGGIEEPRR